MPKQEPTKQDGRPTSMPAEEAAKAPERKDDKRELADAEAGAISGGGGQPYNPPPNTSA